MKEGDMVNFRVSDQCSIGIRMLFRWKVYNTDFVWVYDRSFDKNELPSVPPLCWCGIDMGMLSTRASASDVSRVGNADLQQWERTFPVFQHLYHLYSRELKIADLNQLTRVQRNAWNMKYDTAVIAYYEAFRCDLRHKLGLETVNRDRAIKTITTSAVPAYINGAICQLAELGRIASAPAIDLICDCLAHRDTDVRIAAAYALGKVGGEDSVVRSALENALNDKREEVQDAARDAIQALPLGFYPLPEPMSYATRDA